ncbi:Multidrug resistance protein MexB [Sodalis glossinidius str. 'morsitans']|uniref:Multidrug resistance protein MexB n=1 Tax=Sodalis glossinidius (strain morsitans) TaxID=343509 RepID=A0A193QL27_SODGM|nr:Multidrug resistance protein MexB [Sodalis glossinidius str. 'morsitans']
MSVADINSTLQTAWGSSYVNDFLDRGRVKRVYVQAAAKYRMLPQDIYRWYVRNSSGSMVPFSAFASSRWEYGAPRLERYNGYSLLEIVGEAAPGVSNGAAMDEMEKLVRQLPGVLVDHHVLSGAAIRRSGARALCHLSAGRIPFSVMLVVPLGVLEALLATWFRGLDNDVYFQVGLLTVIGLSAKNAILIVEFANELHLRSMALMEATLEEARIRLRPIVMTSLAFVFGVLPMASSQGAGSDSQHAVGTSVIGGMLSATFLAIFFIPLFYVLIRRRFPLTPDTPPTVSTTVSNSQKTGPEA